MSDPFPWETALAEDPAPAEEEAGSVRTLDDVIAEGRAWDRARREVIVDGDTLVDRRPYVEDEPDPVQACLRSAEIDRTELDGLDADDPRVEDLRASIDAWEAQAARHFLAQASEPPEISADEATPPAAEEASDPRGVGSDVTLSSAFLNLNAVDEILDDLGANPPLLTRTVQSARDTILEVVRTRASRRHKARTREVMSSTDIRLEAVGAADDAAVLHALSTAFADGAKEATGFVGELLDDLPPRAGKARASFKVADGHGLELNVSRSRRTETSVEFDEIVDVLVAHLVGRAHVSDETKTLDLKRMPAAVYADGLRHGIDGILSLLASPKFKVTALDSLRLTLEGADDDSLAKRLDAAYGRKEVGEPTIKIERKEPPKPRARATSTTEEGSE